MSARPRKRRPSRDALPLRWRTADTAELALLDHHDLPWIADLIELAARMAGERWRELRALADGVWRAPVLLALERACRVARNARPEAPDPRALREALFGAPVLEPASRARRLAALTAGPSVSTGAAVPVRGRRLASPRHGPSVELRAHGLAAPREGSAAKTHARRPVALDEGAAPRARATDDASSLRALDIALWADVPSEARIEIPATLPVPTALAEAANRAMLERLFAVAREVELAWEGSPAVTYAGALAEPAWTVAEVERADLGALAEELVRPGRAWMLDATCVLRAAGPVTQVHVRAPPAIPIAAVAATESIRRRPS